MSDKIAADVKIIAKVRAGGREIEVEIMEGEHAGAMLAALRDSLGHDCGSETCPTHGWIKKMKEATTRLSKDAEARCRAKMSTGMRCVFRAGHEGKHMI